MPANKVSHNPFARENLQGIDKPINPPSSSLAGLSPLSIFSNFFVSDKYQRSPPSNSLHIMEAQALASADPFTWAAI